MADLIEVASFEAAAGFPGVVIQDDYINVSSFEAAAGFPGVTFSLGAGSINVASFPAGARTRGFRLREA